MVKQTSENQPQPDHKHVSQPQADDFIAHVNVRWADIDAYQHINNAKMVSLLEDARLTLIREVPELLELLSLGLVVADITVKYKAQLTLEDSPLQIVLWVSLIRASDFIFEYRVFPAGASITDKPAVIAQTRMVAFDVANQKVRRLTDLENIQLKKLFHE